MSRYFIFSIPLLLLSAHMLVLVNSVPIEEELTLTKPEFVALRKLQRKLEGTPTEQWMKSDLALIRWLRVKQLDVNSAAEAFHTNIKWRKENNMDSILEEDWSYFKEAYFFDESGTDKSGRPVISADISEWNVREAVVSGRGKMLLRYMIRGVEAAAKRVRDAQKMGQNVTQWQVILNMDNFALTQHGCLQCLPIYLQFVTAHDTYYPFGADKIIIINTPAAFEVVLNLVRPVMNDAMKKSLMVLGTNRAEWKKAVLSLIAEDQLARQFGGTKEFY